MAFFLRTVHLKTLELHSLSPNDFGAKNPSMLTQAASKGVAPMTSHSVIDRCVWRFSLEDVRSRPHWTPESNFLPFVYNPLKSTSTSDPQRCLILKSCPS